MTRLAGSWGRRTGATVASTGRLAGLPLVPNGLW